MPNIHLLATGGTIAMRRDPNSGRVVPADSAEALLAAVPAIADCAQVTFHNVSNLPSAYMGPELWRLLYQQIQALVQDDQVDGLVVSHGTDTLEETAWFIELCLSTSKPLVFVGAQRHASEADSDGPRNLFNAVQVAASAAARQRGVLVVMNQKIFSARDVRKTHTENLDGFSAGERGMLGEVGSSGVRFYRHSSPQAAPSLCQQSAPDGTPPPRFLLTAGDLPRVDIVPMYAGADGSLIRAAIEAGAQGVVIQALGAGNVNGEQYQAIAEALKSDICVVVSSRVGHGPVAPVYGFKGGGETLQELGALFAADLSPQKARLVLMLALHNSLPWPAIQTLFEQL